MDSSACRSYISPGPSYLTSAKQSSKVLIAPSEARTEPSGSGTGTSCLAADGPAMLPLLLRLPDAALRAQGLSADAAEALMPLLLVVEVFVVVVGGSKMSLPPMLEVRGRITTKMGPVWPCAARARSCRAV